jgi:hypothetical protein
VVVAALGVLPLVALLPDRTGRRYVTVLGVWLVLVIVALGMRFAMVDREASSLEKLVYEGELVSRVEHGVPTRAAQSEAALRALEIPTGHSKLQGASDVAIDALAGTPLFSRWIYLAFALAFAVAVIVRTREPTLPVWLLVSGVLSQVELSSGDFLRGHWVIACSVLVLALVIASAGGMAGASEPED